MLDRIELRKRFLNRVFFMFFARVQLVGGISSRISEDWDKHRILWDLDGCHLQDVVNSLIKVNNKYNLGKIYIISDKLGSYGAVCNSVVTFKELLHILIDTDLIDPLYVRYTFQRHEAILRLSDKEDRPIHREIIAELNFLTDREVNETDYMDVDYETGYIKHGIREGDFYNEQKNI